MSTLLINGCSYACSWGAELPVELGNKLGFDKTVNIGHGGGSNSRTFRTTMEYILGNDSVEFVILMLTFWGRDEGAWAKSIPIEGPWISHGSALHTHDINANNRTMDVPIDWVTQYLELKTLIGFNGVHCCDTLITDLLCLIGWLKSRNIKYCIFGACDMEYSQDSLSPIKKRELLTDPGVINIFEWSSNKFLYENGAECDDQDAKLPYPYIRHYKPAGYSVLNDFLYNYITDNKLL
jgi:hypothetical protein